MKAKIYALQDESGKIRYIGKTLRPLKERLYGHLRDVRHGKKIRARKKAFPK